MPISDFVYRNSVKIDKCSPNGPGKETSSPCQILPTIVVPIKTEKGDLHLRALIDTGSTASFITVSASLSIPSIIVESNVPLNVRTLQGKVGSQVENCWFECFEGLCIMEIDQGVDLDNPIQRALENIPLNEPLSKRGGKIDLFLGMPLFWKIIRGIFACVSDSLFLLDTIYGKVLCGSTSEVRETVMPRATTVEELNKRVEKLWQLDSFPRDDSE